MKIVPYEAPYQEQVIELILGIQREEFNLPITAEKQPDLNDIEGFYQSGYGNFWVAVNGENRVLGTISLLDIGKRQGALRKMFVHKNHRGEGCGTAGELLSELMRWAQIQGLSEIYLGTTAKFLAAHRFYEKNGFQEIEKARLPDSFPVMEVDTRFYALSLWA